MCRYIIKVLMYSFPIVVDCFGYPCGLYTLHLEIQKNTILQRKKRMGACYSIFSLIVSSLKISLVFFEGHIKLQPALGASLQVSNIAEDIKAKIKIYQPALWQSLPQPELERELLATWGDTSPYMKVTGECTSTPSHILGVSLGHNHQAEVMIPEKIWTGPTHLSVLHPSPRVAKETLGTWWSSSWDLESWLNS